MRISTTTFFNRTSDSIQQRQFELDRLQRQVASGKRLLSPSDDPAASGRVLEITNTLEAVTQYNTNADIATGRLEHEDTLLASANNVIKRARELAIRGKNASLTPADRGFLASEVRQRLLELLGLANTRSENGDYLFAGSDTRSQPFVRDSTGNVTYLGDDTVRELQISADRRIADRDTGREVFMAIRNGNGTFVTDAAAANGGTGIIGPGSVTDPALYTGHDYRITFTAPGTFDVTDVTTATTIATGAAYTEGAAITAIPGVEVSISGTPAAGDVFTIEPSANQSVFETLDNLISALEAPSATPAQEARMQQALDRVMSDLDQAQEKMLKVRTSVGARLKAIDSQKQINESYTFQLTQVRSQLEDLNMVGAISELQLTAASLQAAQLTFTRIQGLTLFRFL